MLFPFKFVIAFCISLPFISQAQTSEEKTAYPDKAATKNEIPADTSIQDKSIRYKPDFVTNLVTEIQETSGIIMFNGSLWTINDSGNPAVIYQLDTVNGTVIRKVVVRDAVNTDWEAITQDDSTIYVGDFGNNAGNRTDLRILKIHKKDLNNPLIDTVQAGYIHFRYPDQVLFKPAMNRNNFDCEAFFVYNDSIHLFSKDWADQRTRHYVLPADTGNYTAGIIENFNSDGLITDASVNREGNIILLGYKNTGGKFYSCFCWLLSGYNGDHFFSGTCKRIELGSAFFVGQSEGIILNEDNTAWLTSESIQIGPMHHAAKLFRLNMEKFF
jgi:hypothetical protein